MITTSGETLHHTAAGRGGHADEFIGGDVVADRQHRRDAEAGAGTGCCSCCDGDMSPRATI
jgi:hypothetical protein